MKDFGAMYCKKFGIEENKLMRKLWGDNFYNEKEKKWSKDANAGDRGFVKYILTPIYHVFNTCMKSPKEKSLALAEKMGVKLTAEDKELEEKPLLKVIMRKWLPAGDAMLQMIVIHLPSPVTAQRYRMENLYEGPHDDEAAIGNYDAWFELKLFIKHGT